MLVASNMQHDASNYSQAQPSRPVSVQCHGVNGWMMAANQVTGTHIHVHPVPRVALPMLVDEGEA
jgi:hypothetical protein